LSENALTTLNFGGLQTRKTNLAKFSAGGSRFLRRMQINDNNTYVKQGKISPGNIGIPVSKDEITDLGKKVDLLLLAVREKCLDMNGEKPLAVYDTSHEEFVRIFWEVYDQDKFEDAGGEYDEQGLPANQVKLTPIRGLNGYLHGASFLVFERSTGEFYELYLANGSGREEAKRMEVFLPLSDAEAAELGCDPRNPTPCTLQGKYIDGKQHQWWAPEVLKCSEPFDNLPPMDTIVAKVTEFVTAEIEGIDEEADEGERTR
jgi:hypothetical protein